MEHGIPLDAGLRDSYLARLGWSEVPAPTVDTLFALHRAHVERIAYNTVWIALGERRAIDLRSSLGYITGGTAGYCYHLNGAFSVLLEWLGFDVRRHLGGVQGHASAGSTPLPAGADGDHLAMTAAGHLVDVGLGDALYEPLPLVPGDYLQQPFRFGLRRSAANPGGWRFDHDPAGSFLGFDVRAGPVREEEFSARHQYLMTSPESGFVRVVMAQRRDRGGLDSLTGRVLHRVDEDGDASRQLDDIAEWEAVLVDVFGLSLDGVEPAARERLWQRICADHDADAVTAAAESG